MFRKRVDPDNVPNEFNLAGMHQFNENGLKLVEGDIATSKKTSRNAYINSPKWPNGVVPYEISSGYTTAEKKVITDALATISRATNNCIKFVSRDWRTPTWVSVIPSSGCWSFMGKAVTSGVQQLSLQKNGCVYPPIVMHEFLHALGFAHEQTRPDRDTYIKIYPENIVPGMESNFQRFTNSEVSTLGEVYDYGSIMQYQSDAFSKNGKPTIKPILPGYEGWEKYMGRGTTMSPQDIKKLKIYYGCQ